MKLAAVLQSSAETGTGEVCERAGKKTDGFGKLLPHGKVIKKQTDGYLKLPNSYSWFEVREQSTAMAPELTREGGVWGGFQGGLFPLPTGFQPKAHISRTTPVKSTWVNNLI